MKLSAVCSRSTPLLCVNACCLKCVGPGVVWWTRGCATSRTIPGSIPGGVTRFFIDISSSDRSMALGSTQPLMKMSTRNIPGGKGGRCVRLTSWNPLGHTGPVTGHLYLYFLEMCQMLSIPVITGFGTEWVNLRLVEG